MTRKWWPVACAALLMSVPVWAQLQYAESFRKGPTKITEQSFEVELDPKNPSCRIRIKDLSGIERYVLSCVPQRVGSEDDRILAWEIRLADVHHKIYPNVLMSSPDASQDKRQIWLLDPGKYARIPLEAQRVIRVDSFYCVVQVKDAHFATQEQPYLERMTVDIKFTNSKPEGDVVGTNS